MTKMSEQTPLLSFQSAPTGIHHRSHTLSCDKTFITSIQQDHHPYQFPLRTKLLFAMVAIPAYLLASSAVSSLGPLAPLNKVVRSESEPVTERQVVSSSSPSGAFGSVLGPVISSNFPDPAIYWEDGVTYAFATNNRGERPAGMIHVQVAISNDNETWSLSTQDALPQVGAWESGTKVWAPDVVKVVSQIHRLFGND